MRIHRIGQERTVRVRRFIVKVRAVIFLFLLSVLILMKLNFDNGYGNIDVENWSRTRWRNECSKCKQGNSA